MDCVAFQALLPMEWNFPGKNTGVGAISYSNESSRPRDGTRVSYVSYIGRQVLYY